MPTESQRKAARKYQGDRERVCLWVLPEVKQRWQEMAEEKGRSLTDFISVCVEVAAVDVIPLGTPRRNKEEKADNIIQLP